MIMTACRRFPHPTPRPRWPIHDLPRLDEGQPEGSVAGTIPFNNAAERAIRALALERKNYRFAGSA